MKKLIYCSNCAEYSISTNANGIDKMRGMGITLTYNFNNGYRIGGSYANTDMAIDT